MIEQWHFGYRCGLTHNKDTGLWHGVVYVPRCHPVRLVGFDDLLVLMIGGEWNVFLGARDACFKPSTELMLVAYHLRAMQVAWDRLSPYEREYVIR